MQKWWQWSNLSRRRKQEVKNVSKYLTTFGTLRVNDYANISCHKIEQHDQILRNKFNADINSLTIHNNIWIHTQPWWRFVVINYFFLKYRI